jgi:NADH-quinone oxidoreductase subunit A
MPSQYIPILIFALLAASFPAVCFALLKPFRADSEATDAMAEAGDSEIHKEDPAREAHPGRFYFGAVLFVIFDVAIVFLFPWSIGFSQMGWYGLISMTVFLAILLAGYAWLYKNGTLDRV